MNNKYYYWISTALKSTLMVLIICVVYGLFIMDFDKIKTFADFFSGDIIFYFIITSLFIVIVLGGSQFNNMVNITLSLGGTRRDAFKGIHLYNIGLTTVFSLILAVMGIILGCNAIEILLTVTVYVFTSFAGSGMTLIWFKSSAKSASIMSGLQFGMFILATFFIIFFVTFSEIMPIMEGEVEISELKTISISTIVASVIAGTLLYSIGTKCIKKHLSTFEVSI